MEALKQAAHYKYPCAPMGGRSHLSLIRTPAAASGEAAEQTVLEQQTRFNNAYFRKPQIVDGDKID